MNARNLKRLAFALAGIAFAALPATAAPVLKADVSVTSGIVTVGDMFDDAGAAAKTAIFRAPAPGTAGYVSLDQVRSAASAAGLTAFDSGDVTRVHVARTGERVGRKMLDALITSDLHERGLLGERESADITFNTPLPTLYAARKHHPATLIRLSYAVGNGAFEAHFDLAGIVKPLVLSGRIEVMVKAPFLARTLDRGTVIGPDDIDMRRTPKRFATTGVLLAPEQIVGKVLRHQSREGLLIRPNDLGDQQLVARNDMVTVYLRKGPLTLTVKGQALNDAAKGEPVSVLNLASKKTIHGKAVAPGAVEIDAGTIDIAGL